MSSVFCIDLNLIPPEIVIPHYYNNTTHHLAIANSQPYPSPQKKTQAAIQLYKHPVGIPTTYSR